MGLNDGIGLPKKTLTIFFVIDTSGSMEGIKMSALNRRFNELIAELREAREDYGNVRFRAAVLAYSYGARWVTGGSVEIDKFNWPDLEATGITDFGAACKALNEKLSRKPFKPDTCPPVIIVTTDGEPSDDWKAGLAELMQNEWFKCAAKWGIAIGEDADRDVLAAFTGNRETVLDTFDIGIIKRAVEAAAGWHVPDRNWISKSEWPAEYGIDY